MNNIFRQIKTHVAARWPLKKIKTLFLVAAIGIVAGYLSLHFLFDSDPRKPQLLEFVNGNDEVQVAAGSIQQVEIIRQLYGAPSENEAGYRQYTFQVKGVKATVHVVVRVDATGESGNEGALRLISIR
jgi:hypothetical protein